MHVTPNIQGTGTEILHFVQDDKCRGVVATSEPCVRLILHQAQYGHPILRRRTSHSAVRRFWLHSSMLTARVN
jgi:hypothetical protein